MGSDDRRHGGGGHDKIQVPEYSGEDDRDGLKAKGYIRKVEAWRRVTRLSRGKQALMLYNSLSGRAWRDAEELDLSLLDTDNGVEIFLSWIKDKYMDREVTKVGRYMSDFFKVLKKTANQDIRDFNQEFDRQISRLREVGCTLPDNCLAWWYVDKMRLDNATELNLLSSVGNLYNLQKLQDAAIIQDRMNRRLWERRPDGDKRTEEKRKGHQALMTSLDDDDEDNEEPALSDIEEEEFIDDEHTHEAFVAFRNAKSKYRAALKERGYTQSKDERLQQAKARSYCSVCHKKGHWHKDPECPANKGKQGGEAHTTHVVYITQNVDTKNDFEE